MLEGLVNRRLDEKINSVKLEDRLLRKMVEVTPLLRKVKKVTKAMLQYQDFLRPVAIIVKKEAKELVNARSEREDRNRKFFWAT